MSTMGGRSISRRTFVAMAGPFLLGGLAGCSDDENRRPEPEGAPDISETITEPTEYALSLRDGDILFIRLQDNDPARFIEFELVPPSGASFGQSRTSVDTFERIDRDGEYVLRVVPDRPTKVELWIQ